MKTKQKENKLRRKAVYMRWRRDEKRREREERKTERRETNAA